MLERRRRMVPSRVLQIGFAALLILCMAQVAYWITDEAYFTRDVQERFLALYSRESQAADRLRDHDVPESTILEMFDHLEFDPKTGVFFPSDSTLQHLRDQRHSRLNRYGWEGMFFILVLVAAITILIRTLRRDSELRRRQQNFLAAVSHEFKSPLASIQLAAETLDLRELDPEKKKKTIARILSDSNRLQAMVSNLLNTSRLEQGSIELAPQTINLSRAIAEDLDDLRVVADDASVSIECTIDSSFEIFADEASFHMVLRNLVDNAIKASKAKENGQILIRAHRKDTMIQIDIQDNGNGFESSESESLFDMFYRPGDELRRTSPGTGLGLFIVRRFVEMNGGDVIAMSDGPGRGANFRLTWPTNDEDHSNV